MATRRNGNPISMKERRPFESQAQERGTKPQLNRRDFEKYVQTAAYFRFMNRGGQHGNDLNDWLEAEREVKRRFQLA